MPVVCPFPSTHQLEWQPHGGRVLCLACSQASPPLPTQSQARARWPTLMGEGPNLPLDKWERGSEGRQVGRKTFYWLSHSHSGPHPFTNCHQVPPCSGILQVPEPAPPFALGPSVTCSKVSSGGQAENKKQEWPMATSCPASGLLRAQMESRHCPFLSGQYGQGRSPLCASVSSFVKWE